MPYNWAAIMGTLSDIASMEGDGGTKSMVMLQIMCGTADLPEGLRSQQSLLERFAKFASKLESDSISQFVLSLIHI